MTRKFSVIKKIRKIRKLTRINFFKKWSIIVMKEQRKKVVKSFTFSPDVIKFIDQESRRYCISKTTFINLLISNYRKSGEKLIDYDR